MDDDAIRATKFGVLRLPPAMADPTFNTQTVKEMKRAQPNGEPLDNRRRQVVMNPRGVSTALVLSSLARLCDLLFQVYGRRCVASEPKVLLTLPRANPLMPHGDAADRSKLETPPRMIHEVMAVEDGSHLDTWPCSSCQFVKPDEEQCAVLTCLEERVLMSVGFFFAFCRDMVHRGVENASLNIIFRRMHAYLTPCDAPMASERWRDETCPGKGVAFIELRNVSACLLHPTCRASPRGEAVTILAAKMRAVPLKVLPL